VTWIDGLGNSHTTDNVEPLIGSNGLWGIVVEMTMRVRLLGRLCLWFLDLVKICQ
jgi:hypothetical protein